MYEGERGVDETEKSENLNSTYSTSQIEKPSDKDAPLRANKASASQQNI